MILCNFPFFSEKQILISPYEYSIGWGDDVIPMKLITYHTWNFFKSLSAAACKSKSLYGNFWKRTYFPFIFARWKLWFSLAYLKTRFFGSFFSIWNVLKIVRVYHLTILKFHIECWRIVLWSMWNFKMS